MMRATSFVLAMLIVGAAAFVAFWTNAVEDARLANDARRCEAIGPRHAEVPLYSLDYGENWLDARKLAPDLED